MLAAYSQTAWVIVEVGSKAWQHVVTFRYQVVVATLKKQPMAPVILLQPVFGRKGKFICMLRHRLNRKWRYHFIRRRPSLSRMLRHLFSRMLRHRLNHSCHRLNHHQLLISLVTPCLKTTDYLPQMLLHRFLHKKDTMKMVGHQLESQQAHLMMELRYQLPTANDLLPQRRWHHTWSTFLTVSNG